MIETRQILEELQLKNVLATSSTGAIFLARDTDADRDVVIKMVSCGVLNAEDEIRRLFLEMAEAARSTEIQAMPALTDHGLTPEGDGFLVMDFIEGQTLDTLDDLSVFAATNILLDVLSCIEDLARAGTAHLNLVPSNLYVTNPPANDRAKVLGFGTSATLLHAGAGVPVPAHDPHLAPELVSGNLLPSSEAWRSDLFSLGVIACGALGAEIEADGYERPCVTLPPAVRSAMPEADPLEAMLGQIMEPDPQKRGNSPSDVRDPLIRALPDPTAISAPPVGADLDPKAGSFDAEETVPTVAAPSSVAPALKPPPPAGLRSSDSPAATQLVVPATEAAEAEDGDGWPEVLFDDPELPHSLDETEDTDVRNPIPVDVWVPDAGAIDGDDPVPAAVPPTARQSRTSRRVSRIELAVVAAVVIVLGAIIAFTWSAGDDDVEIPVATAIQVEDRGSTETLVPPPPDDNLFDDLLAVQQLVDADDLESAREALYQLESRDGLSFSSDESALYDSLVTVVAQAADRGAAIEDLRAGYSYGSVKMVRRGVAGVSGLSAVEIAEVDGLAGDLEKARRALRLHSKMWDAQQQGDHLGAIGNSWQLEALMPGYSGSSDVRNQAASALEIRTDAYVARGEYENAIALLESLRRVWPDREGAAARIVWCQGQLDLTRRGESVIASALAKGEAGDPEAGFAILDEMNATPELQDEIDRARKALENRLAEMDADDPIIQIASAMELSFKKNETVTVPLKVSDDYRVERVVVHARNEADDGYLQLLLQPDGEGLFSFVVAPELHGNKNVYFYVVARDVSGHIGRLGSQEEPQRIARKKWFKKLL